ncbi:MAG: hypothetical protein WBC71_03900, partial [Salaquimonas sp.]
MRVLATLAVLMISTQPVSAETCEEKFVRLMTDRTTKEPTQIHVTQQIKGSAKTVNWNYQDGKGNWRTEMIEPANAQWSMVADNILYTSSEEGKTWQKVREMDEANADHEKSMKERAATVENAVCGNEDLDGASHEVVEADYKMLGSFEADIHDKFWIHPETGYVPRLETTMKNTAFESFLVQILEPA